MSSDSVASPNLEEIGGPEHEAREPEATRQCFYCHMGRVCIGSVTYDGEEVFDLIRCRRCNGSGVLTRGGDATKGS